MSSWQHDVVLQTLYSAQSRGNNALYFDYSLAQARADVFFSLLFGGKIICSAGMFFDSLIAIRIFGELFSDPRFNSLCQKHRWHPLKLNTDNPQLTDPKNYIIGRWENPEIKFGLFREGESDFISRLAVDMDALKKDAAECIRNDDYVKLRNIYEPFLIDYEIDDYLQDFDAPKNGINDTLPERTMRHAASARIAPLLTKEFSEWLQSIVEYLSLPDCFVSMDPDAYAKILSTFVPLISVKRRTEALTLERFGDYDINDLRERNKEFESLVGNTPTMNALHRIGLGIYGHYYPLVNHWIEMDWHATRHAAYLSSACVLSSNWEARQVFDFDATSKVHYLMDTRIDDTLRLSQEKFGELDWGILLDLIADSDWRSLIAKIKDASEAKDVAALTDQILNMLSKRITSFSFDSEKGRLSISAKHVRSLTGRGSALAAILCTAHYQSSLEGLLGIAGLGLGAGLLGSLNSPATTAIAGLVPGARWVCEQITRKQLRTAIVPNLYLRSP
jgi:hypothetical protein